MESEKDTAFVNVAEIAHFFLDFNIVLNSQLNLDLSGKKQFTGLINTLK